MLRNILLIFFCLFAHVLDAYASRKVVIFGGGDTPNGSQASIELNTKWIIDVIKNNSNGDISHILYTDGNKPGIDVYKTIQPDPEHELFQPLARVFGKNNENFYQFYSGKIAEKVEPATSNNVEEVLKNTVVSLEKGDELLIIFQGHGGHDKDDSRNNSVTLWDDTELTVTDFAKILNSAPPDTTLRFVFPQCFSGAFSKLVYKDLEPKKGLIDSKRCGFFAQRKNLISEGCTSSVNTDSYRDYSTYFFSAFSKKTISNKVIKENTDYNNDGKITLREAHTYALINANSIDYSKSTSEDYLENWKPWYLKLLPKLGEPNNIYTMIASDIAKKNGIVIKDENLVSEVSSKIKDLEINKKEQKAKIKKLEAEVERIQDNIKNDLSFTWPYLKYPYTFGYWDTLNNANNEIQGFISNHNDYQLLVESQEKLARLENSYTDIKRNIVQMNKILRMRKLADTLSSFMRFASDKEKSEYNQLVKCEDAVL